MIYANSNANAIGVGVYVANKIFATITAKNELFSFFNCKDIWLQILHQKSRTRSIVGIVYCPLGDNEDTFTLALNNELSQLTKNENFYFVGDININVSPNKPSTDRDNYFNMNNGNAATLLIEKPTRIIVLHKPLMISRLHVM